MLKVVILTRMVCGTCIFETNIEQRNKYSPALKIFELLLTHMQCVRGLQLVGKMWIFLHVDLLINVNIYIRHLVAVLLPTNILTKHFIMTPEIGFGWWWWI